MSHKSEGSSSSSSSSSSGKAKEETHDYPAGPNWIALINPKSGGQSGQSVLKQFRELQLLPEDHIFSLIPDGPDAGLKKWLENPEDTKIVVCGGDGTAGWVLSALDKLETDVSPAVGVIPLGTGNDLARVFGWGGGYGGEKLAPILEKMNDAKTLQLDRWKVVVTPKGKFDPEKHNQEEIVPEESDSSDEKDDASSGSDNDNEKSKDKSKDKSNDKAKGKGKDKDKDKDKETEGKGKEDHGDEDDSSKKEPKKDNDEEHVEVDPQTFIMNNYFSVGIDAEIALSFHHLREAHTSLFQNLLINKGWYGAIGAKAVLKPHGPIRRHVKVELDGKEIHIPRKVRGILVINLPSYMGGTQPWGHGNKKNEKYSTPAINDGLFEVIGLKGALHLARIQTRTSARRGIRLGQGRSLKMTVTRALPAQVDGEPWAMVPCEVTIDHLNKANLLYNIHAKDAEAKEKTLLAQDQ